MAESAIIVSVAIPRPIATIRDARVPVARIGVPPHVTILYPFLRPNDLGGAVRKELAGIAHEIPAFLVRFAAVGEWPGVLYLLPEPTAPFATLIDRVTTRYPEHPPYAGTIAEVILHLTVVEEAGDAGRLDEIAAAIRPHLPFEARATALDVIVEGADGRWRRRWRLPFRS
jgi:2'-5' RNA ligase